MDRFEKQEYKKVLEGGVGERREKVKGKWGKIEEGKVGGEEKS